ncbi:hypothetical protein [Anianabacter salinae]|uniref:hypothetical protein n=1 Tax=Anianabacter salinae TaxID=2851023 RepID=UPI00225E225A|nr:hypothetical protein [Anianabacter salinae]MBV0913499.1 hypothetical protein [Anianabacter salinae]
MAERTVTMYLDAPMLASARAGKHNYINRLDKAFRSVGFDLRLVANSAVARAASRLDPGYALFHMNAPGHDRALNTRRAYFYPFWRIEASADRWAFRVAREAFDPGAVDPDEAERFAGFWRKRLFGELSVNSAREKVVFVPLQGKLTEHRSFQTMSPLDMLRATLAALPGHEVVATLHPGETYTDAERRALDDLSRAAPRFRVTDQPSEALLQACDLVVTQNSSVALSGFFFGKPAVLFAQIDFHHIAFNVGHLGVEDAFAGALDSAPPFDRYLHWFLQGQSINAGKENAEERILSSVRHWGWQM